MQLANAQLQLANNPELASEALKLADQRVRELADPTFTPVRRALAEEIASLATLSTGDIEGASLTLGSLMSMVDTLPIDQDVRSAANDDTSEPTTEDVQGLVKSITPLRRLGAPADIAAAVVALASALTRFVTGQFFAVDGGLTMP